MNILLVLLLWFVGFTPSSYSAPVSEIASDACRVSCTISVGGVGVTATAGGIFTSCERAGDKACAKATVMAVKLLVQSN